MGYGGWGTDQALVALKRVGLAYEPDIVISQFFTTQCEILYEIICIKLADHYIRLIRETHTFQSHECLISSPSPVSHRNNLGVESGIGQEIFQYTWIYIFQWHRTKRLGVAEK